MIRRKIRTEFRCSSYLVGFIELERLNRQEKSKTTGIILFSFVVLSYSRAAVDVFLERERQTKQHV